MLEAAVATRQTIDTGCGNKEQQTWLTWEGETMTAEKNKLLNVRQQGTEGEKERERERENEQTWRHVFFQLLRLDKHSETVDSFLPFYSISPF